MTRRPLSLDFFPGFLLLLTAVAHPAILSVTAKPLPEHGLSSTASHIPEDSPGTFEGIVLPPPETVWPGDYSPDPTATATPTAATTSNSITATTTAAANNTLETRATTGKRSFTNTCFSPISISGTVFSALCQKNDGSYVMSSVNLNKCVKNDFGFLAWNLEYDGKFGVTCPWTDIYIDLIDGEALVDARLRANCTKFGGGLQYSELGLDRHVYNLDGQLGCGI
ncbi:hypothetical protein V8F20_006950 [Naviculisporaceae sp. PSN 640]